MDRPDFVNDTTKIFFSDFDGTLADSEKNITPKTREALDGFAARGGIFVLSTGRAVADAIRTVERLSLMYPHMYICGYNGAELYDCAEKKDVFRKSVPIPAVRGILQLAEEYGVYCQTYDRDVIVTGRVTKETEYYTRYVKMKVRAEETDPAGRLSEAPCKCLAIELEDAGRLRPFRERLGKEYGNIVHSFMSSAYYLEIVEKTATKGSALKTLSNLLGVPAENTFAAGDAQNDISMIKEAGCGIAMCSGLKDTPELALYADVITVDDNDHDGLAPILNSI